MASREQIEREILNRAKKKNMEVDWKRLALYLLEWQSSLYPGRAPEFIERSLRSPKEEDSA